MLNSGGRHEKLRRRLQHEAADPDFEVGISVFVTWYQYQKPDRSYHTAWAALCNASDEDLDVLWVRFMLEDSDHAIAAQHVWKRPYVEHETDCTCAECEKDWWGNWKRQI